MRFQAMGTVPAAVAAGLALAACSTARPGSPGGPSAPAGSASPGAHAPAPVEPDTAAAVRADADDYLTLYTAGQFAIIYQMLSAPARQAISEQAWVAVHRGCPAAAGGMSYRIRHVAVTGKTAVVTVALTGGAAKPENATETLVYAGGHWDLLPGTWGSTGTGACPRMLPRPRRQAAAPADRAGRRPGRGLAPEAFRSALVNVRPKGVAISPGTWPPRYASSWRRPCQARYQQGHQVRG